MTRPLTTPLITKASEIPWWRTDLLGEERTLLLQALEQEHISMGPQTARLEQKLASILGVRHAVFTTSGSAALMLSMLALGIKPGDRVIVPNRTFIATAHAAHLLGAAIDLVDCLPDRPVMDATLVEAKITSRTKAILPVHLNGRSVDMDRLIGVATRHGVPIVEDACQALFSRDTKGRVLGTIGDMGCYSFGMTKIVSCGQGGVVVTNSDELYRRLIESRNHGIGDAINHTYVAPGFNYKPTDLLAALGLGQVHRREEKIAHCIKLYRLYEGALANGGIRLVPVNIEAGEVPLWVEVATPKRDALMAWLAAQGVQTRRFLPSLESAPHLATGGRFPNSDRFAAEGLVLPCGPSLAEDKARQAIDAVLDWARTPFRNA